MAQLGKESASSLPQLGSLLGHGFDPWSGNLHVLQPWQKTKQNKTFSLQKYKEDEPLFTSSLWGPSCDELDQIMENCLLPELNVGDWLIFDNMGADSLHEPSAFNDFQRPAIYYMMSYSDW